MEDQAAVVDERDFVHGVQDACADSGLRLAVGRQHRHSSIERDAHGRRRHRFGHLQDGVCRDVPDPLRDTRGPSYGQCINPDGVTQSESGGQGVL